MKRIVALLLALTLVFALASCKPDDTPDGPAKLDITPVKEAIAATALTSARVEVVASNDFLPEHPLTAKYDVVYNADGSASVVFTYDQYNDITPEGGDIITTSRGSATVAADGTVTGDPVSGTVTGAASVSFNLDESKLASFDLSMGILSANVAKDNTAAVLGSAINADVVLTVATANGVVTGATISYDLDGVHYEISCTYN